jgi:hypothetical protein
MAAMLLGFSPGSQQPAKLRHTKNRSSFDEILVWNAGPRQ